MNIANTNDNTTGRVAFSKTVTIRYCKMESKSHWAFGQQVSYTQRMDKILNLKQSYLDSRKIANACAL